MSETTLMTGQDNTAPAAGTPSAVEPGTAPVQNSQTPGEPAVAQAQPSGQAQGDGTSTPTTPQEYTDFTTPEGYTLDGEIGDAFKATARELGLSQDQAQKLIDLDVKRAQAQQSAMMQASKAWAEATASDPEIGGDKLAENQGLAKKALAAFGTPELVDLLDKSGLGNHPEVVRVFVRAGKAISEDRIVTGQAQAGSTRTAQSIYAASNMNP